MSHLSDDTAKSTMGMAEKLFDEVLRYLLNKNSPSNTKEKTNKDNLHKKTGYVKLKELYNSGDKLIPLSIKLTENQLKEFSRYAKKYDLVYSSVSNKTEEGKKERTIIIKEKDLQKVSDITDIMNRNLKLKSMTDRIEELESKKNKTPEEVEELKNIIKSKEEFIVNSIKDINKKNEENILNKESVSFEKSLNKLTDYDYSKTEPYYVCERTNPSSYIELNSTRDIYNGSEYTKTEYKVFKNDVEQKSDIGINGKFTDEKFKGRSPYYWVNIRKEMKVKGGFTDNMLCFKTKKEFEKYKTEYTIMQEKKVINPLTFVTNGETFRNYGEINKQLSEQLDKKGVEINSRGNLINKNTKEIMLQEDITGQSSYTVEDREILNINNQIHNYNTMNAVQNELVLNKSKIKSCEENLNKFDINSEEHSKNLNLLNTTRNKVSELESTLSKHENIENQLKNERSLLASIQTSHKIEKEEIKELKEADQQEEKQELQENEENLLQEKASEDNTFTIKEWEEKISKKEQNVDIKDISVSRTNIKDLDIQER